MGNEINRDSAVYFDSVRRHLARAPPHRRCTAWRRALCIGPLPVSLCSLGGAPSAIRRLADPRWRTRPRARARSIFAVSMLCGRSILAGVARRRRSRDSRTLRNIPRDESTFDDLRRCKSLLIICHFSKHIYIVRDIIKSYSFVVLCCKNIGHRRENNESFITHTIVFC